MRTPIGLYVEDDTDIARAVIGVRADGTPIVRVAGGAALNINDWIPIEYDDAVVQAVRQDSAVEAIATRVPMSSKTKSIPRSAGVTVTAGTTYTDDTGAADEVTLTARRFISRVALDEDDLDDASSRMDVLGAKGKDWATSYADTFDNACLAVTGTENGTTVPVTSVYKTIRTTDSDVSYTADVNLVQWDDDYTYIASTPDGTSLYEKASATFAKVENGKYWSQADMVVIAHPSWRDALRNCLDGQKRPIFIEGTAGTPDTLFNTPIRWSRGCKTSATMSGSPSGNALLIYVNRRYLARGDRSGPETRFDESRAQDDTDNVAVKFRTRRGFKLTHPMAAAVLERLTD